MPDLTTWTEYKAAPGSFHSDGKRLAYTVKDMGTSRLEDILVLSLDGTPEPQSLLDSEFSEHSPQFAPDGHWLAYVSDETGLEEVYVRPFPGPGQKIAISSGGGREPVWSPVGDELFYRQGRRMMVVPVDAAQERPFGQAQVLFEGEFTYTHRPDMGPNYDVSPGGRRFLMVQNLRSQQEEGETEPTIVVIQNWFSEFRDRQ